MTGTTFDAYCKEYIFDPLGMTDTAWFSEDLPTDIVETQPMSYLNETGTWKDEGHFCFIDYASGQLRTTAHGMSLFLSSMLDYCEGMLPTGMVKTALECAEPGNSGRDCSQGISWLLLDKTEEGEDGNGWLTPAMTLTWDHAAAHDGSEMGSQTQVVFFPESKVYALVFTNTVGNHDKAAQYMMQELPAAAPSVMQQGRTKTRVHTHTTTDSRTHAGRNEYP